MSFYAGEPAFEFEARSILDLAGAVQQLHSGVPLVIAIDGRSGGGKTTLAKELADLLGAQLLHTDDFAWWHSFFDWPEMLIDNALKPLKAGQDVDFTPPAWIEHGREGSIVAKSSRFVIVEGVGASQLAMRAEIDLRIWIQCDAESAKERGLVRDAAERPDPAEAEEFWNTWQKAEDEFQGIQESWKDVDFVVRGDSRPEPADTDGERGVWLWSQR